MTILVSTIYCDDIRAEVGGKQSFMGVYNAEMLVSELPLALPKLCAQVTVRIPMDEYPDELKVKLLVGEVVVTEANLSQDDLAAMLKNIDNQQEDSFIQIGMVFVFMQMPIEEPTTIRVRAYVRDVEYKGNGMKIRAITTAESEAFASSSHRSSMAS